jgi:hypothetical protein
VASEKTAPIRIEIEGAGQTLRALNALGKDANKAARDSSVKIAELMAGYIRTAGQIRPDKRDKYLASTVRVNRDRLPSVSIGGRANPKVSGGGTPANLVYGMEFGASKPANAWRFPARTPRLGRGNAGYWIYPTARRIQPEIVGLWYAAIDTILRKAGD